MLPASCIIHSHTHSSNAIGCVLLDGGTGQENKNIENYLVTRLPVQGVLLHTNIHRSANRYAKCRRGLQSALSLHLFAIAIIADSNKLLARRILHHIFPPPLFAPRQLGIHTQPDRPGPAAELFFT
jgi:hypothetical protein